MLNPRALLEQRGLGDFGRFEGACTFESPHVGSSAARTGGPAIPPKNGVNRVFLECSDSARRLACSPIYCSI
jgi:hypothetical protein